MPSEILRRVLRAPVYDIARETPLERASLLSGRLGNEVYLKREDLQPGFSFKLRGAYNRMVHLSPEERAAGVIASSAGNHAQGVARAAARLGLDAVIVMPVTTPAIKVDAVRALGGKTVLHGDSYDAAYAHARALAAENGRTFIHPYDDPDVIAGQGTIALELLRQQPRPLDVVVVCVGGGGLIAGIASVFKEVSPDTTVIGVEPRDAACMTAALQAGERVVLDEVGIFADGVAVAQVGEWPFRIAQQCVDHMITVDTDEICAAIKDIFDDTRAIAEPAGAVGVAGLKRWVEETGITGQTIAVTLSGANINFDRLRHIAERTQLGEGREALFAATIDERPGSFRRFCGMIGPRRSITEFNYRYGDAEQAHVFVGVALAGGRREKEQLLDELRAGGVAVQDLTDNEMAKLHLRYMVGGAGHGATDELLYRFEFPERPGALLQFLEEMTAGWNISLFHYRNHGAAFGRVLVGVQVPPDQHEAYRAFLRRLGYHAVSEQQNPGYPLFLRPRQSAPPASSPSPLGRPRA